MLFARFTVEVFLVDESLVRVSLVSLVPDAPEKHPEADAHRDAFS
ncbi:hypothetical protein [Tessaracoccus sp. ZS01]|nr:hypothetical protein [Tessaracoccus sp. ZS01]